jgi:uncharacterized protein YeeX (DUF496 family)
MSSEQKAVELFAKFTALVKNKFLAQDCALAAVQEIIQTWKEDGNERLDSGIIYWWQQVEKELKEPLNLTVK